MSPSQLFLAALPLLTLATSAHSFTPPATSASPSQSSPVVFEGTVFYDLDEDGVFNPPAEVPLVGWRVEIRTGGGLVATLFTDATGQYMYTAPGPGTYQIDSVAPPPGFIGTQGGRWLPTTPIQVTVAANMPLVQVDFGNLYMINTPQFARSKEWWAFQGREALYPCDPVWRRAINNVCARQNFGVANPAMQASTQFTVSLTEPFSVVYEQLRIYLTQPHKGVLAYILSAEFVAAKLNTECGPLEGLTVYIERQENGMLVPLNQMIANTRALLCNPRSANTGPDSDDLEWKLVIEQCLMEWAQMGSSGTSIYTPSPDPVGYPTPY